MFLALFNSIPSSKSCHFAGTFGSSASTSFISQLAAGWLKAIISDEHYAEKYFLSVFHLIFALFLVLYFKSNLQKGKEAKSFVIRELTRQELNNTQSQLEAFLKWILNSQLVWLRDIVLGMGWSILNISITEGSCTRLCERSLKDIQSTTGYMGSRFQRYFRSVVLKWRISFSLRLFCKYLDLYKLW